MAMKTDEMVGSPAVVFFKKYNMYLMEQTILTKKKWPVNEEDVKQNLEGGDILCYILDCGEKITVDEDFDDIPGRRKKLSDAEAYNLQAIEAGIEVKGHRWGQLLTRDNNSDCPSGTIDFELWEKSGPGWLQSVFDPKARNRECECGKVKTYGIQPYGIVNLYERPRINEKEAPKYFACIAFTDIEKLKERLEELKDDSWNFYDWKTIPGKEDGRTPQMLQNKRSMLIGRQWHIPFELVSDIATVTLIDDDPPYQPYISRKVTLGLFNKRLQYLKKQANGRHLDTKTDPVCPEDQPLKSPFAMLWRGKRPALPEDEVVLKKCNFDSIRGEFVVKTTEEEKITEQSL